MGRFHHEIETMARFKRGAKAQAIRDAIAKTPEASAQEIVAAVKESGLRVTPQMVYGLRARAAKGPKKRRGGRIKASSNGAGFSIDTLILAKKLANQLGGVEKAKEAMDALAKLQ